MKVSIKYFIIGTILTASINAFSQKISINKKTLELSIDRCDFKTGSLIGVEITNNNVSSDYFTVEISGNQYANSTSFPSGTKGVDSRGSQTLYLLALQVPDFDKSEIKISRFNDKNVKQEERIYTYRNKGGLKFDVSTGFFATGLKDKNYVLKPVTESTRQIISEDSGNFRVGIGILAHLQFRSS